MDDLCSKKNSLEKRLSFLKMRLSIYGHETLVIKSIMFISSPLPPPRGEGAMQSLRPKLQLMMRMILSILISIYCHRIAFCQMAAAKRFRPNSSSHVDVTDKLMYDCFSMHLGSANGPSACFPYSKGRSTDHRKSVVFGGH